MIKNTKVGAALSAAAAILIGAATVAYAGSNSAPSVAPQAPVGSLLGSADLWAVINADATIARSDGAAPPITSKVGTGAYQVGFFRDVTGCNYVATIGNAGAGNPAHGTIVVAARAGVGRAVFVETRDVAGALVDRPFHLRVTC